MWIEPLTPSARATSEFEFVVTVSAGDGTGVAEVRCPHSAAAAFGYFGEMSILDAGGGVRQTMRALVLLVREALRYAAEIGITRVRTDVPPRLRAFAGQLSGIDAGVAPGGRTGALAGALHEIRSHALLASDGDGALVAGKASATSNARENA